MHDQEMACGVWQFSAMSCRSDVALKRSDLDSKAAAQRHRYASDRSSHLPKL